MLALTAAVLVAAVLHAVWNALVHAVKDRLVAFVLLGITYAICSLALVPVVPAPAPASRSYLAASVALHAAYNLLLLQSYRLGDFNQVYPLARGTSPLVVAAVAALVIGERLGPIQLGGVALVSAGLASLVVLGQRSRSHHRPELLAALGTGLTIAAYTVVDGIGVRRSDSVLGYAAWLFLLQGPVLPLIAFALRRRRLAAQLRAYVGVGGAAGALSLIAYGLVLWAQTRGALAAVAALRETSVIVGATIGAVAFREPFGRHRIVAAVAVAAGVVLLNVT